MIDPNYESLQRRKLKEVVANLRLLGIVFAGLGGFPLLLMRNTRAGFAEQLLAMVDSAVLIGPGVWYLFAAQMIRKLQIRGVRVSLRVAWAQLLIIALVLVLATQLRGQSQTALMIPAFVAIFLVPALIAQIFQLLKARGIIHLLDPEGHAFEAIPVAAIARVASNSEGDANGPSIQG